MVLQLLRRLTVLGAGWVFLLLSSAHSTRAADPLLPDLIAWEDLSRCYMHCGVVDNSEIPNKVIYRFRGALPNIGAGPLEIREVTHPDFTQDVYQRIYDTQGAITEALIGTEATLGHHLLAVRAEAVERDGGAAGVLVPQRDGIKTSCINGNTWHGIISVQSITQLL